MNATTTLSPHQDTRGFVHNASALHTTPPAHPKATKRTFHLFRKADILTRQRHRPDRFTKKLFPIPAMFAISCSSK